MKPLKSAIPELVRLPEAEAAARLRRMLEVVRTLGLASHLRGVEQTPETSFVLSAALRAYPAARAVHIVRDGRDVVCSLLERGWLERGARRRRRRGPARTEPTPASGSSPRGPRSSRGERSDAEPRGRGAATSPLPAPCPSERSSSATKNWSRARAVATAVAEYLELDPGAAQQSRCRKHSTARSAAGKKDLTRSS